MWEFDGVQLTNARVPNDFTEARYLVTQSELSAVNSAEHWLVSSVFGVLILGIVGSLIAWLIVIVYLSRFEADIRRYAERAPSSIARFFYYRLLLAVIRGRAHSSQTYILGMMLFVGAVGAWTSNVEISATAHRGLAELDEDQSKLDSIATTHPTAPDPSKTRSEIIALHNELTVIQRRQILFAWFTGLLAILLGAVWLPYSVLRRTITFEYERLMVRLSGIVTKDEFRDLTRLEMRANNSSELDVFLRSLHSLTRKYDLRTVFSPR